MLNLILRSDLNLFYWDTNNEWVLRKARDGKVFDVIGSAESQDEAVKVVLEWM